MYDHERSLVEEMDGKPFKLIGVNFHDSLGDIRAAVKEKNLNWRSFFLGHDPAVLEGFNVQAFPTVMIIDANGVVRWTGSGENDKLIGDLLEEIEDSQP